MSNFFEQELRKLFEDGEIIGSPRFMGTACMGMLGGDLRARAEFIPRGEAYCEDLYLTVLDRTGGVVDKMTLRFEDIWGEITVPCLHGTRVVAPHFRKWDGKMTWCDFTPTAADYQVLRQAAGDYLGTFREQMPEQEMNVPAPETTGHVSKPKTAALKPKIRLTEVGKSKRRSAKRRMDSYGR